ncbi:MAG: sarcosine oxidase subunit gamma family protein [Hellea sp.]
MLFNQAIDIPESLNTDELKLVLMPERLRYSVRAKASDLTAIKRASGVKLPSKIGASYMSMAQFILCLGPGEWLIIADPQEKVKLAKALAKIQENYTVSLTDVSHRNIGFALMGPRAVKMLNVGCPLDLSLEAFPVGRTTRTVFESASIVLTRTGENDFAIECWRSFAPYLRDFFARIAEVS